MSFQLLPETPLPVGSQCAAHAGVAAQQACRRCGAFACVACTHELGGLRFCATCAERDEVNYLEGTRRRFWGTRDVWVWLFALSIPGLLMDVAASISDGAWLDLLLAVASLALLLPYLLLRPWARKTLFLLAIPGLMRAFIRVHAVLPAGPAGAQAALDNAMRPVMIASALVFLLFAAAAYASPRNRLAFRLPLSDVALQRVYDTYIANPLARRAALYGTLTLLVPIFGPLTLWMSWAAYRKTRDATFPPVSGAGLARVGLVTSGLSTLVLLGTLVWLLVIVVSR
jgi:hypothetical protein